MSVDTTPNRALQTLPFTTITRSLKRDIKLSLLRQRRKSKFNNHSYLFSPFPEPLNQMSFIVTVVFPNDADAQYDIEYYTNHHMPLILKDWAKYGVTGWNVREFAPGPDGSAPLYAFGSDVFWKSAERLEEAFKGPETGAIMADVPKFSNKPPVFLYGNVVGSG